MTQDAPSGAPSDRNDILAEQLFAGAPEPQKFTLGTAIYAEQGGQILLIKRAAGGAYAGQWYLPGGAVDPGESPDDAVVRELREESGLEVSEEPDLVGAYIMRLYGHDMLMLSYRAPVTGEVAISHEHTAARWVKASDMREAMSDESLAAIAGDNERALAGLRRIRDDLDRYLRRIGS
jgi:8-oxo-dGTP diphosphatase